MLSESKKERLFYWADILHQRFFGHSMSMEMRTFLGNLSWSFFGGGISSGTLFLSFIFLGWFLGPAGYGKFTLIYAGILFVTSLTVLGFDSGYIKFAAQFKSIRQQQYLILKLASLSFFVYSLVALIFSQTEYSNWIYIASTPAFIMKAFADAFIRQKQNFSLQQKARFLECLTLIFFLAVFFELGKLNVEFAVIAYAVGALSFLLTVLCHSISLQHEESEFISARVTWRVSKGMVLEYSLLLYINGLVGFFYSYGDKFILSHYVDNIVLGRYSIYYTVSVMLISQLTLLFINVFFPVLVEKGQSSTIARSLERLFFKFGLYLFLPLVAWIYLIIGMLGNGYTQSIFLSVLFSLFTYINTFFLLLWWQIAALGNQGVRFMIKTGGVSVCIFLSVFFLGVGYEPVYTTVLALSLALIFNIIRGRKFLLINA